MVNMAGNGTQFSRIGRWNLEPSEIDKLKDVAERYSHLKSLINPDDHLDQHLMVGNLGFETLFVDGPGAKSFALCSRRGIYSMIRFAIRMKTQMIYNRCFEEDPERYQREMHDLYVGYSRVRLGSELVELPRVYGAGYDVVYYASVNGESCKKINEFARRDIFFVKTGVTFNQDCVDETARLRNGYIKSAKTVTL